MRKLFTTLAFFLPFTTICQSSDQMYHNQVKISAVRLINILNPGFEISYERLYGKRYSTQLSFGYPANTIGKPYKQLKGYSFDLEEKYFIRTSERKGSYVSIALNYSNINHKENTTEGDSISNIILSDTFTIRRKTQSISLKYGVQFYRKRFVMDLSIGAGVKHRDVTHPGRTLTYAAPREFFDLLRINNVERNDFTFILPINFRIGYRF